MRKSAKLKNNQRALSRRCPRCDGFLKPELTDLACVNCGWRQAGVFPWRGFFSGLEFVGLSKILWLMRNKPGEIYSTRPRRY